MSEALTWCRQMLPRVSRTFAIGIQALPEPLEQQITAAYLLCRVVDTVEDAPGLPWVQRRQMFMDFEDALMGGDPTPFTASASALSPGDEAVLCARLDTVLDLIDSFDPQVQASMRKWVGEMGYGMATYARRHEPGGQTTLHDPDDLHRYCWYVAGTVGHLLTDLFVASTPALGVREESLRRHATGFSLLLQMTNIVKDVTDDWERGWCFIPASLQRQAGVPDGGLLDPSQRGPALQAIDQVNHMARSFFPEAVAYCAALPADNTHVRRFCLLPMLLAGRTLMMAQGHPSTLSPGAHVKISREAVTEEMARVEALLQDDAAIAALTLSSAA
jgi:farnesyl-diphosphate farnesyltransferase